MFLFPGKNILMKNIFVSRKKHISEKYFYFKGKTYKGKIFLFPGKKNIISEKYFCFQEKT